MKRIVIFSHGFGVAKDSAGLFTDIAEGLGSNVQAVLFDYNDFDETNRTMTVKPFSQQATILNQHLEEARRVHPGVPISLVAHSQGCIVAAIAEPQGIDQVVLLAPAESFSLHRLEKAFTQRFKPKRLPEGSVKIPRRDGSSILIPAAYQPELKLIDPPERYNRLAKLAPTILIRAAQDDILGKHVDDSRLSNDIKIIKLDGDHNFNDPGDRQGLIAVINDILTI
jgi:predicted alpha/beta-hydrolase family hydrolase